LKLFVLAITPPRSAPVALALLVVSPIGVRRIDIALLALLRAARQEGYQSRTVLSEINPVARSEIDSALEHAFADRFDVGEVALLQPGNGARDPGAGNMRYSISSASGLRVPRFCLPRTQRRIAGDRRVEFMGRGLTARQRRVLATAALKFDVVRVLFLNMIECWPVLEQTMAGLDWKQLLNFPEQL
jgi:hypothetical protein